MGKYALLMVPDFNNTETRISTCYMGSDLVGEP